MDFNIEKLEVRQLTQNDLAQFRALIEMFNMVFEEEGSTSSTETSLQRLLSSVNFIAIAAILENQVVGGLTAYYLPKVYSANSEVFLYDMAVRPECQRRGIGKRLFQQLKEYCIKHGVPVFFVLAHEEDQHAVEFYHSTGGKSEKVVNFIFEAEEPGK